MLKFFKSLFIKIKFNISDKNNKVYKLDKNGNKRLVTNKIELFKYLKRVKGKNNVFIFPKKKLSTNIIVTGDNNTVEIKNLEMKSHIDILIFGSYNSVFVDDSKYFVHSTLRLDGTGKKIEIGKGCMFAKNTEIWTGDGHSIYDLITGEKINKEKDVIIGNNVWVGKNTSIHKGAIIPDGCVIGACSFVTKEFSEKNCIIAGMPAKIIKKQIRWEQ